MYQLKSLAVIGLIAAGVGASTPLLAADAAASREPQRLEIVVDRERNLAFVPEGTVIPAGLEIGGSRDHDSQASASALVFAYAPESTFSSLREHRDRILNERAMGLESQDSRIASHDVTGDRSATPIQPLNAVASGTCPVQLWLEYGPGFFHEINCHRPPAGYPSDNWWMDSNAYVVLPSTTKQIITLYYTNGTTHALPASTWPSSTLVCRLGFQSRYDSQPSGTRVSFEVSSRLPKEPYCPTFDCFPVIYESSVTLTVP